LNWINQKVVVIGAGINGLTAANYLRRAGFEVALIERV
jgi:phytoene dehydrogenase-like protein